MTDNIEYILRVFRTLHRLKELPRQGFIYFRFKGDETDAIAEHSFMVTWIAYILADELDARGFFEGNDDLVSDVIKMALIHDWGEAVAGDLSYRVKGDAFADSQDDGELRNWILGKTGRGKTHQQQSRLPWV